MSIILYTTAGCHLCEEALEMVRTVAPTVTVEQVDIAEDEQLVSQYGNRIPVLAYRGEELGWPFNLLDVQRLVG